MPSFRLCSNKYKLEREGIKEREDFFFIIGGFLLNVSQNHHN